MIAFLNYLSCFIVWRLAAGCSLCNPSSPRRPQMTLLFDHRVRSIVITIDCPKLLQFLPYGAEIPTTGVIILLNVWTFFDQYISMMCVLVPVGSNNFLLVSEDKSKNLTDRCRSKHKNVRNSFNSRRTGLRLRLLMGPFCWMFELFWSIYRCDMCFGVQISIGSSNFLLVSEC